MKDESCETCKHNGGDRCKKHGEKITPQDWCGEYKRRKKA
jgi:hypothetical protein